MSTYDKWMFDDYIIEAKPAYTHDECIEAAKERGMSMYGDEDDGYLQKKENLMKLFCNWVYMCGDEERIFFQQAIELTEKREPWVEDVNQYPFFILSLCNFVYLFSYEDNWHLVAPVELIETYREVIAKDDFAEKNLYYRDLHDYATALCNLFGTLEIDRFVDIWNQLRKDKITYEEAEGFLYARACFHSVYYCEFDCIIHNSLNEDDFDELMKKTGVMDHYMPTKSVIKAYANDDYMDPDLNGQKALKEYLSIYVSDSDTLESLLAEIFMSCEHMSSPEEVQDVLLDYELPIDDMDFCKTFERLYNSFRDNVHIWELCGFTPRQYKVETGEGVPWFALPKTDVD